MVAARLGSLVSALLVLAGTLSSSGCADGQHAGEEKVPLSGQVPITGIVSKATAGGPQLGGANADIRHDPAARARKDGPKLGAIEFMVSIYETPDRRSKKLGYLRVGSQVQRAEKAAAFNGCHSGLYNILPHGYVCLDDGATLDLNHPLLRAGLRQADHTRPLPYDYAFVRAIAPRYYRLPRRKEQFKYEMSLKRHLRSFKRLEKKWNAHLVGANDVPIDKNGVVVGDPPLEPPALNTFEKFGGSGQGEVPWFFERKRKLPNIASFKVPNYAVITNRIKRHAGVALIDAFRGDGRDFALTTDLRLIPTSKLKPGRGSTFHGVELTKGWELPVAFSKKPKAYRYKIRKGKLRKRERLAYGDPVQLTGEVKKVGRRRMLQTDEGDWVRTRDFAVVAKTSKLPRIAGGTTKWIDISIQRQTLVLYEGATPQYATMVSTGKDGLGDPKTTHSTPRGTFKIRNKFVTATMDSDVLGSAFELNDVPWVQYFKSGYALHAAYWHTEYGRPRSHGCINLAPIDAYRIFAWTDPPLPSRWHSVVASEATGDGTYVHVHP
jgi:lipoprotein-anchoring transpeptidase ErfK/SrfK